MSSRSSGSTWEHVRAGADPVRRIYEVQAFLTELVSNFQFELSDDAERVRKTSAIVMVPTLDNEIAKGVQMPLRVSLAPREE